MNDDEVAVAVAFRMMLEKSGKSQKVVAVEIGLTTTAVSKILNFKQGLTFLQAYLFCSKNGVDISELSMLVDKILQDGELLKSVHIYQSGKEQLAQSKKEIFG